MIRSEHVAKDEIQAGTPIVVLGGPGSLKGAAAGSLIIGMADTYGQVVMPEFARVTIYALMGLILIYKPAGLFPVRSAH